MEELLEKVKPLQTDKDGKTILLYASNEETQHSYIEEAKAKGYEVLLLDSPIVAHLMQKLEQEKENLSFTRVDSDSIENLIKKEEDRISKLSDQEQETLKTALTEAIPQEKYTVQLEALESDATPFRITQPEFMRRMKEMQQTGGECLVLEISQKFTIWWSIQIVNWQLRSSPQRLKLNKSA